MNVRWLEEYTAKELCRNATIRESQHRRLQLRFLRFNWRRLERERHLLAALSRRFGLRGVA